MPSWIALIEVKDHETPIIIKAIDQDSALKRLHIYLKAQNPDLWTDDWEDLRDDVEEGNQILYGPFKEIPQLI